MFFQILKKDLKRNKTMNVILFLFIVLATVFVSGGLSNLVSVISGLDYYIGQAVGEKDDYFLSIESDGENMKEVLDSIESVKSYGYDEVLSYSDEVLDKNKKKIEWSGGISLCTTKLLYTKLFDSDNKEIKNVEKGHVYISVKFINEYKINVGDEITLKLGDKERTYIVDGGLKDAVLGSRISGNNKFLLNEADYDEFHNSSTVTEARIVYIEADDVKSIKNQVAKIDGLDVEFPKSTIVMTYIIDIMVAFIIVILSICLIIVSFVILKFSIGFTIQDDFREIGVMKAIGLRSFKIRRLYLTKYMALAAVGAVIGCIISFPFGNMLMKSVTENMMLGNTYGKIINLLGALLVFFIIMWLAYISTGKVKKMTPIDAIRNGETGERFKKKRGCRISKSHSKNFVYLAWNDIVSSPKRFLNIVISFGICSLFLLILSNFTATLDSTAFIDTFCMRADIYLSNEDANALELDGVFAQYDDSEEALKLEGKKANYVSDFSQFENGIKMYEAYLKKVEEKLSEEGIPAKVSCDVLFTYNLTFNDKDYNFTFIKIMGNKSGDYPMTKGSAPQNKNEIAITNTIAKSTGIKIGDTVEIDYGDKKEKCTVTGMYQSLNNLGNVIRLYDDAPVSLSHYSGNVPILITFTDNPSEKEIEERKEKIKDIFNSNTVLNQREFCVDCIGALDAMKAVELLLVAITVIVIILVTIMMERSFITKEKKQIAILKAIGFRDSDVKKWQVMRFLILSLISVVIAMAVSVPVTDFAGDAIFSGMGADSIKWAHSISGLIKYPVFLVALTVLIAWLTSLYSGKIKARDTASIE